MFGLLRAALRLGDMASVLRGSLEAFQSTPGLTRAARNLNKPFRRTPAMQNVRLNQELDYRTALAEWESAFDYRDLNNPEVIDMIEEAARMRGGRNIPMTAPAPFERVRVFPAGTKDNALTDFYERANDYGWRDWDSIDTRDYEAARILDRYGLNSQPMQSNIYDMGLGSGPWSVGPYVRGASAPEIARWKAFDDSLTWNDIYPPYPI